jgi:hypothetical protein
MISMQYAKKKDQTPSAVTERNRPEYLALGVTV